MPNLLKKIIKGKKEQETKMPVGELMETELFITIILSDQELQAALVSKNQEIKEYSAIKTYFDRQDLLTQLDQALQDLGPLADEVADCVFVFDETWLEKGDLQDSKKVIVKDLTDNLSLLPLGQMSISEGIHQARIMKDPHDSSIVLYLRDKDFDLLLIKHGKLLANLKIGRSARLSDDLQEGLARISQELGEQGKYFPNKVFLSSLNLPQKVLNKEQAELQAFDWTTLSGFLQMPEFVVLSNDFLIKSLSLAASYMLSKNFASKLTQEFSEMTSTDNKDISDQDVASNGPELVSAEKKISSFGIDLSSEKIDLEQALHQQTPLAKSQAEEITNDNLQAVDLSSVNSQDQKKIKSKSSSVLKRFFKKNKKSLLIGVGGGLLALITLFFVYNLFLSDVTVKVTANERILQKNLEIILDPQLAESDFTKNLLKVSLEEKEIKGEDTLSTTGISLVGDKAQGKVKLFNKTFTDKTFSANTIFKYEDIAFVLNEEVTVPAAVSEEEDDGQNIDYGSVEVALTAQDIGAEGNIGKDSKLAVADFSENTYSATAIEDFSGGSSREIRVVSQKDLDNLQNQLKENLYAIAVKEFKEESKDGVYYVPTGESRIVDFAYDHEEGDEVETLSLTMTLAVEAVKYSSSDLKQLAEEVLLLDLPENYEFVDEEPSLLSDEPQLMTDGSNRLVLDAELSAKAKAKINQEALNDLVLGKSLEEAKNNLEEQETIDRAEIILQPAFMGRVLQKLPKDSSRFNFIIN
jgi:hypothetical protein